MDFRKIKRNRNREIFCEAPDSLNVRTGLNKVDPSNWSSLFFRIFSPADRNKELFLLSLVPNIIDPAKIIYNTMMVINTIYFLFLEFDEYNIYRIRHFNEF